MEYTGERFVPEQQGNIELEHLHRYLCAAELSAQKDVLDIASGEGYGSSILARVARSVIGVDISASFEFGVGGFGGSRAGVSPAQRTLEARSPSKMIHG